MNNLQAIYIFLLTVFLACLYQIEDLIEKNENQKLSKKALFGLVISSSLTAGIIGTMVWFILEEVHIQFTIFGVLVTLKGTLNVFIAVTFPFFYKEIIHAINGRIRKKGE